MLPISFVDSILAQIHASLGRSQFLNGHYSHIYFQPLFVQYTICLHSKLLAAQSMKSIRIRNQTFKLSKQTPVIWALTIKYNLGLQ